MSKCSNCKNPKPFMEIITGEDWRTVTYTLKIKVRVQFCSLNCIQVWEHRQEAEGKEILSTNEERK